MTQNEGDSISRIAQKRTQLVEGLYLQMSDSKKKGGGEKNVCKYTRDAMMSSAGS